MHFTKILGIVRRIEREAARRGFNPDVTADDGMLPDTGTINQQAAMALVGVDSGVRIFDLSTRDQELVRRLIQNCVLSGPRKQLAQSGPVKAGHKTCDVVSGKFAREWRRRA